MGRGSLDLHLTSDQSLRDVCIRNHQYKARIMPSCDGFRFCRNWAFPLFKCTVSRFVSALHIVVVNNREGPGEFVFRSTITIDPIKERSRFGTLRKCRKQGLIRIRPHGKWFLPHISSKGKCAINYLCTQGRYWLS